MPETPKIDYPCMWTYALIAMVSQETALRAAITNIVAGRKHTLTFSRRSTEGHYFSLHLEVYVRDDFERNLVFRSLKKAPGVKMVI